MSLILRNCIFGTPAALFHLIKESDQPEAEVNERNDDFRWRQLCEAILTEPNQDKLHELIRMLNDELEARENRLARERAASKSN